MTAKGQMVGGQPDCVQMTYGNGYDQATMQLSQSQYSGQSNWTTCPPMNHPHPGHPMNNMAPSHGQYPTNYYPTNHGSHPAHAIYNQNHPIVSQTMASRDTNNYPDFRPAGSEFEFRTNQNAGMQLTYYRLNDKADGTGFVVRGRKLYYNKRQSREVRFQSQKWTVWTQSPFLTIMTNQGTINIGRNFIIISSSLSNPYFSQFLNKFLWFLRLK